MKKAILATKIGMTQIFNENGVLTPVTVLQAGPCFVTQVKTVENDGYSAQIVGPTGSIVRGQRIEEQTKDPIIPPVNNQWPSDHKGVLITFYIKE